MSLELTILIPCLNEEKTVGARVAQAKSFIERNGISGEVIVADNGSVDRSKELAERAGAKVIKVERQGYGAALLAGIYRAEDRSMGTGLES